LYGALYREDINMLSRGINEPAYFLAPAAINLAIDIANDNSWFGYSDSLGHQDTRNSIAKLESVHKSNMAKLQGINCNLSEIGCYSDKKNTVGPNSEPDHTVKIASYIKRNKDFCLYGGEINHVSSIIKPALFAKPLRFGGNFDEFFAPMILLQEYEKDSNLSLYFENEKYKKKRHVHHTHNSSAISPPPIHKPNIPHFNPKRIKKNICNIWRFFFFWQDSISIFIKSIQLIKALLVISLYVLFLVFLKSPQILHFVSSF